MKRLPCVLAIALALATFAAPGSQAADGEKLMKKCKACHTWNEGGKKKVGPNLFGVTTRPAGSSEGFKYSKGFRKAQDAIGMWDDTKLDAYLADPSRYLKSLGGGRSRMTFKLKKEKDRAAVIDYLGTLK